MKNWVKALLICLGIGIILTIIGGMVNSNNTVLDSAGNTFLMIGILTSFSIFGLILYFIPSFVAEDRKHKNRGAIGLLNFFIGWTFIGWVICLVWASSNQEPIKVEQSTNGSNKYEDLERLTKLKEMGTITQEEFEIEKEKILK